MADDKDTRSWQERTRDENRERRAEIRAGRDPLGSGRAEEEEIRRINQKEYYEGGVEELLR